MLEKKITIINEMGLHARPAGLLAKECQKYQSEIILVKNDKEYNCKSIMSVMSMGAKKGDEINLKVKGPDEEEAFNSVVCLLESNLD